MPNLAMIICVFSTSRQPPRIRAQLHDHQLSTVPLVPCPQLQQRATRPSPSVHLRSSARTCTPSTLLTNPLGASLFPTPDQHERASRPSAWRRRSSIASACRPGARFAQRQHSSLPSTRTQSVPLGSSPRIPTAQQWRELPQPLSSQTQKLPMRKKRNQIRHARIVHRKPPLPLP